MKVVIFKGVPNNYITAVALNRLMNNIGINTYSIVEKTHVDDYDDEYIPSPYIGVELNDEDATLVTLKYSSVDVVEIITTISHEMLSKLKSSRGW